MTGRMEFSSGLKHFEIVAGDANGQKWKLWKRSFELYLLANKIEDDDEKVTLLLLQGGPVIQILSDRLPNAIARAPMSKFTAIIVALDSHFISTSNGVYERHILRKMEQGPKELMGNYVLRLREQGSLCNVDDLTLEILLVDQIVEKGRDRDLRSKILKDNLDINGILKQARILEVLSKHVKAFEINEEIADINHVRINNQENFEYQKKNENIVKMECFNCGNLGHRARDSICKAKSAKCYKCNQIGHFGVKCRGKSRDVGNFKRLRENEETKNEFEEKKMRSYGVFDEMQLEIDKSDEKIFF